MNIFETFLAKQLIKNSLFVMLLIIAVNFVFTVLSELSEISGNYNITAILVYSIMQIPELVLKAVNFSVLIGVIVTVGFFNANNELVIFQNASISQKTLSIKIIKHSFVLVIFLTLLGELFSPYMYRFSANFKSFSLTNMSPGFGEKNIWVKKENTFYFFKDSINGKDLKNVLIIEKKENDNLSFTKSDTGLIQKDQLLLNNPQVINFTKINDKFTVKNMSLDKDIKNFYDLKSDTPFINSEPESLSIYEIIQKILFFYKIDMNSDTLQINLLNRVFQPLNIFAMLLIALAFSFKISRTLDIQRKIFFGVVVGLGFHLFSKILNVLVAKLSYGFLATYLFSFIVLFGISMFIFYKKILVNDKFNN